MIAAVKSKIRQRKDLASKRAAAKRRDQARERDAIVQQFVEALEQRLAPAGFAGAVVKGATFGEPILLKAGEVLSSSTTGGAYLLGVEKGQALIFLTDLNHNNQVDSNEITGISAGDGLRLTAFADINGDIVTNLKANGTLTDFDPSTPGNDGRVVLNSKIENITFRVATAADVAAGTDFRTILVASSLSLHGNIYAGGGLGVNGDGLIIDTAGWSSLTAKFNGVTGNVYITGEPYPQIGNVRTGSAVSGQTFSFGITGNSTDLRGNLATFTPAAGQIGGDILGVKVGENASGVGGTGETAAYIPGAFSIGGLFTGNGGSGARGGDIRDVALMQDIGTFYAVAGNGGSGNNGANGGSVLNLSSLDAHLSGFVIRTGDGGVGFNGKGGDGGSLTLGEFSTTANVIVELGDGGDGTAGGGKGAGVTNANIEPIPFGVPVPQKVVSTYRGLDEIGTQNQIDFNGDGIGDIVYISQEPNQLVVRLGMAIQVSVGKSVVTQFGITDASPTYYLDAPIYDSSNSAALSVGDFNGDGRPDIVTASSSESAVDGIYVYLWNDKTDDFDSPLRSAIPYFAPYQSGAPITNLVTGDFDGDAVMDIAFTGQYISQFQPRINQTDLVIMRGTGDGFFYVNYGPDAHTKSKFPVLTIAIGQGDKGHPEVLLQATSIDEDPLTAGPDLLATYIAGTKALATYQYTGDVVLSKLDSEIGLFRTRSYNEKTDSVQFSDTATKAVPLDFTILDADGDGIFDLVSLNQNGYLVAFQGTLSGEFAQVDKGNGILLTGEFGVLGDESEELNGLFKNIVTGDFDGDGDLDLGLYVLGTGDDEPLAGYAFSIDGLEQTYSKGSKAPDGDVFFLDSVSFAKPTDPASSVIVFSGYQGQLPSKADPTGSAWGYVIGTPQTSKYPQASFQVASPTDLLIMSSAISSESYTFEAGDGGDSQLGAGGAGGSFGGSTLTPAGGQQDTTTANINILIPGGNDGFSALFQFNAGNGGNGFTAGGAGGNISGMYSEYTSTPLASTIVLAAGDGGNATQGRGGDGGSISKLSLRTLGNHYDPISGELVFKAATAGDGGNGLVGGNGGSITGNGIASLFDSYDAYVSLAAGFGGNGITTGGNGGGISNFKVQFLALVGGIGGLLDYQAGDGGSAISGKGGAGGSVINSGPDSKNNNLSGPVSVRAGNGGNGLAGGNGGSITTFINKPTFNTIVPTVASFLAGNGGYGVSQNGGTGGNITGVSISAKGLGADPSTDSFLSFNRFIAGEGGDSFGAVGGNGGTISNLTVASQSTSSAIAAGAAGDGLLRGGIGGSVLSTKSASGGPPSKNLIIAGDGGDAYGFKSSSIAGSTFTPEQKALLAFGGVDGIGGNGGSINGFDDLNADVVTDLIAGNGGNLINYGSPGQSKSNVGRGGSISNVTLIGSAGDLRDDQAILSYNAPGTSMADFVANFLAGNGSGPLNNTIGNVGVVAGAAGRVAGDLASSDTLNGSVSNFSANDGIMSMVAGSVNRISAILSLSKVTVGVSGVIGAYKAFVFPPPPFDHSQSSPLYYAGPNGTGDYTKVATAGGSLIDGAILTTKNSTSLASIRLFTT